MKLPVLLAFALLFSLYLVSAEKLSISPSFVPVSLFPGESKAINLTVLTDNSYAIYITHSIMNTTPVNLSIFYDSPQVGEGNLTVPVTLTASNDSNPGKFTVIFTASAEVGHVPESSQGSGGGSGGGSGFGASFTTGKNASTGEKLCTYTPPHSNVSREIRCDLVPTVSQTFELPDGTRELDDGGLAGGGEDYTLTDPQDEPSRPDMRTLIVLTLIVCVFIALMYWLVGVGKSK